MVIGAPGIMLARRATSIGASWQREYDRAPLREKPAPSKERHRSCACACERTPSSARRSHVLESPGGLLATGESGGTGTLVRRWRQTAPRRSSGVRPERSRVAQISRPMSRMAIALSAIASPLLGLIVDMMTERRQVHSRKSHRIRNIPRTNRGRRALTHGLEHLMSTGRRSFRRRQSLAQSPSPTRGQRDEMMTGFEFLS